MADARRTRVMALTAAALAALAMAPGVARADDDRDEAWGRHHRRHGRWHGRPTVVRVVPPPLVVVVPPPVVVRPAYVWVEGRWEERTEVRYVPGPPVAVWVPGHLGLGVQGGRVVDVAFSTGHYAYRPGPPVPVTETVRTWVPGRWVPAREAHAR
jgi:hypothetical protein